MALKSAKSFSHERSRATNASNSSCSFRWLSNRAYAARNFARRKRRVSSGSPRVTAAGAIKSRRSSKPSRASNSRLMRNGLPANADVELYGE
jgi:hypothetical protein